MATVRIGTSGWSYDHWENVLYPPGLPVARRRDHYTREFDTVELNASFYRWPPARTFTSWNRALPPGFEMAVKAPRGLTHARRLYGPETWLERIDAGLQALGDRAGPLLFQLDPRQERDDARLAYLLHRLPERWRAVVEFRHPSWHVPEVFSLLEQHGVGYVVMSGASLPCPLVATARTVYVRLHGPSHDHLYAGSYSDADRGWWRDRVVEWRDQQHDVRVYFNNDGHGFAVHNARRLHELLT